MTAGEIGGAVEDESQSVSLESNLRGMVGREDRAHPESQRGEEGDRGTERVGSAEEDLGGRREDGRAVARHVASVGRVSGR